MTEEEKKEKKRKYAREYYNRKKDDPEFLAKRKAYRDKYYSTNSDVKKAQQKSYYDAKIKGKNKEYYQRYYREHKDKMREYARKWREANKEKSKAYMRKYNKKTYWLRKAKEQAKKESNKIQNLSTDKIATIFKNPAAAQHYKWLMQKRGVIKTESEVEHEVTA